MGAPAEPLACLDSQALDAQEVLRALSGAGAFSLRTPELAGLNAEVLSWFARFDAQSAEEKAEFALAPNGTGENNGWHGPGGLSAYNRFRDGFIFQADEPIWPMLPGPDGAQFAEAHERWRSAVHRLGHRVMRLLARALGVDEEQFVSGGQCDVAAGAQFHLKAVRGPAGEEELAQLAGADGRVLTLPAHRDPSVISLVVATGPGLQILAEGEGHFLDVPRYGPGVCTVLGGQVLTKLTRGLVRSPLHRVLVEPGAVLRAERVAATFFFQPPLDAVLRPLDCPAVSSYVAAAEASPERADRAQTKVRAGGERGSTKSFAPLTYGKWKQRRYRRYYARAEAEVEA